MADSHGRPMLQEHKNSKKMFDPVTICSECGEPLICEGGSCPSRALEPGNPRQRMRRCARESKTGRRLRRATPSQRRRRRRLQHYPMADRH
jgi:hypothetical protein